VVTMLSQYTGPQDTSESPCDFCSSNHVASDIDLEKPVYFSRNFFISWGSRRFALLFAPDERAKSSRYKVAWRMGKDVGAKFSARRD
jgi:hypothetical protein